MTRRNVLIIKCLNHSFSSTVVRTVRVVKTGLLSHCFHYTVKFVNSQCIGFKLQLLSEFFCSVINTHTKGCTWFVLGFWSLFRIDLENNNRISFAR